MMDKDCIEFFEKLGAIIGKQTEINTLIQEDIKNIMKRLEILEYYEKVRWIRIKTKKKEYWE